MTLSFFFFSLSPQDQQDYKRYRLYTIYLLPHIKFLDSSAITTEESAEARRVGQYMKVVKPQQTAKTETEQNEGQENGEDEDEDEEELQTAPGRGKVSFGMSRYVYYGKNSEGNR